MSVTKEVIKQCLINKLCEVAETLEGKVEAYEVKRNYGVMELRRDGTTDLCI